MDAFGLIFLGIWVTAIFTAGLYVYVYYALKRRHPELWDRLFSGGLANARFWKWVSDDAYPEISNPSFKRTLVALNRLSWFSISAIGITIAIGIIWAIWKIG